MYKSIITDFLKLIVYRLIVSALIPRQFPPHVQYGNTEGEGLGDLVMCGDVRG